MADSNSSDSEAPPVSFVVPGGIRIERGTEVAPKYVARPATQRAAAPTQRAAAPTRAAPTKAVVPPKLVAPTEPTKAAAPVKAVEPAKAVTFAASAVEGTDAAEVIGAAEEAEAVAEVAAIKDKVAARARRIAAPPPADALQIAPAVFNKSQEGLAMQKVLAAPRDAEIKPADTVKIEGAMIPKPIYVPISSRKFQNFITQTFVQYSSLASQVRIGPDGKPQRVEKELDKEACKKRDPNKTESFYYQKFVRDYLSRDTPYRGLLVYHGLGTGKTCTSVAAAEALYWGGRKTIWVLTPATLSNNYRREIAKCGYFPLRHNNYWQFLEAKVNEAMGATSPEFQWLRDVLGLPDALIQQQGGGWVPDPNRPSNWDTQSDDVKQSIRNQIQLHMQHRFKFIHYNGVRPATLAQMAYTEMEKNTSPFDDAVVIIDEIHNLVRTINGTKIGSKEFFKFMAEEEPSEFNWTMPRSRTMAEGVRGKYRYPRGYTFYRLLQNAVNAKIIALSATPMINYAQEFAILMNIVGGEQRTVEISLSRDVLRLDGGATTVSQGERIRAWAKKHPEIDYYEIEQVLNPTTNKKEDVLTLTPVPHGFVKVVDPKKDNELRGFVRKPPPKIPVSALSNERNMDVWGARMVQELEEAGIFVGGIAAAVRTAVETARSAGRGTPVASNTLRLYTYPLLPDAPNEFVSNFINRTSLKIERPDMLKARATGLISYYRGGSEELMPRADSHIVNVPMSDYMFNQYILAREAELEMESKPSEKTDAATGGVAKQRGRTAAEADLYAQAIKTQQTGFMALSRAACNFVFPEDVPRPKMNAKQKAKLLGIQPEGVIAADLHEDTDAELNVPAVSSAAAAQPTPEEGAEAVVALADEPDVVPVEEPADRTLELTIGPLMAAIDAKAAEYLNAGLTQFSPKYAEIIGRIRQSPGGGPVLVYSQFKTLEGLGLFAAALRASDEKYLPLDIVKNPATQQWEIPAALMDPARPRYILYTGDQDLDKRRLLLQLYNADVAGLPPKLSEQCATLLAGAPDNRDGRICKVFMITQSGAEGISLFNTRQVHIMEPYWNNVRLEQVQGRAIRLCSHMNLPWEERTVDVFTYLSVFSAEQKTGKTGYSVLSADEGKTTDEQIYYIAGIKQQLADGLFQIAQAAATDCQIHFLEQGESAGVVCFEYADGSRPGFTYHPDYKRELAAFSASAATGGR